MATPGSRATAGVVARAGGQQAGSAGAIDRPREFRRELEDPEVSVAIDIKQGARTMLIAFGGMRGALGMPPFEFLRATGRLRTSRIFVRDLAHVWYHRGIPGLGSTIEDAAAGIRTLLGSRQSTSLSGGQRLIVTGTSAGGYAALVFGTLLGADVVLSIVPQTVVDDGLLRAMGDHRYDRQLDDLIASGALGLGMVGPATRSAAGTTPRHTVRGLLRSGSRAGPATRRTARERARRPAEPYARRPRSRCAQPP